MAVVIDGNYPRSQLSWGGSCHIGGSCAGGGCPGGCCPDTQLKPNCFGNAVIA